MCVVCHIFDVSSYALKVHSHPDDIKAVVVFFASMRSNNSALECHRRRATAFGFSFIFEARMREIMYIHHGIGTILCHKGSRV